MYLILKNVLHDGLFIIKCYFCSAYFYIIIHIY